ncbi:D-alanyl-D-alanine carboxypeptidase family protein [Methylocella sp.]|uniref:D-alanyl-D-alanine carboxypeptidase family protein n=1 Tax=Methylocella sp. TaxID=1978226 RepID=UPI0035B4EAA0
MAARRAIRRFPLLLALLATALWAGLARAETIDVSAPHAILIDYDTGSVLFEKGADEPVTPASTVKIMTVEVVFDEIEAGRVKLDDQFTVSEHAWRTGGAPSRSSSMFAALNSHVRVEDLIRGAVIVSGNDAAIALAEGVAGSEQAFVALMNKRAAELGLKRSTFANAWGMEDPGQKVTARDMAALAIHLIAAYPNYYKYFSEKDFTWGKIRQTNRNPLLTMEIGADGLKTGNIDASGFGLVGSAVQNGQRLVVAIYGAPNAKERAEEARKLLLWGFRSFTPKRIFATGETVGAAKVFGGASFEAPLVAKGAVTILTPRVGGEKISGRIVYQGPLAAPVEAGKEVARLKLYRGGVEILDAPLVTAAAVPVGSLPQQALGAGVEYVGGLLRKYLGSKLSGKYVAKE